MITTGAIQLVIQQFSEEYDKQMANLDSMILIKPYVIELFKLYGSYRFSYQEVSIYDQHCATLVDLGNNDSLYYPEICIWLSNSEQVLYCIKQFKHSNSDDYYQSRLPLSEAIVAIDMVRQRRIAEIQLYPHLMSRFEND